MKRINKLEGGGVGGEGDGGKYMRSFSFIPFIGRDTCVCMWCIECQTRIYL